MRNRINFITFAMFFLFSCKEDYYHKININYDNFSKLNKKCQNEFKGHFTFYNVAISNYYCIDDFNKIGSDFDKDGINDSIAIVVPKQYNSFRHQTDCNINENDDLLLVIIVDKKVSFYKKIVSKKSILEGQEIIVNSKNGFILIGDWGHSSKKFTEVYVNYYQKNFYIDSIKILREGKLQYNIVKRYNKGFFELKKYSRNYIDFLDNERSSEIE